MALIDIDENEAAMMLGVLLQRGREDGVSDMDAKLYYKLKPLLSGSNQKGTAAAINMYEKMANGEEVDED